MSPDEHRQDHEQYLGLPIVGLARLFDGLNLFGVGAIRELGNRIL